MVDNEVWLVHHKKEDVKMAIEKKELPKVKIRLRGLERGPIELTILPRKKMILDENGVVEVDEATARKLLSPEYAGTGWEMYKEKEEPAKGRKSKAEDETVSKEEFAHKI